MSPSAALVFGRLSSGELEETLRELLESTPARPDAQNRLQRLVHELQVHRCELEMQNRALRDAQGALEHSVHRYADLYDSLPIGYLTLTRQGRIVEANREATEMLGTTCEQLAGMFLTHFLSAGDSMTLAITWPKPSTIPKGKSPKSRWNAGALRL